MPTGARNRTTSYREDGLNQMVSFMNTHGCINNPQHTLGLQGLKPMMLMICDLQPITRDHSEKDGVGIDGQKLFQKSAE